MYFPSFSSLLFWALPFPNLSPVSVPLLASFTLIACSCSLLVLDVRTLSKQLLLSELVHWSTLFSMDWHFPEIVHYEHLQYCSNQWLEQGWGACFLPMLLDSHHSHQPACWMVRDDGSWAWTKGTHRQHRQPISKTNKRGYLWDIELADHILSRFDIFHRSCDKNASALTTRVWLTDVGFVFFWPAKCLQFSIAESSEEESKIYILIWCSSRQWHNNSSS